MNDVDPNFGVVVAVPVDSEIGVDGVGVVFADGVVDDAVAAAAVVIAADFDVTVVAVAADAIAALVVALEFASVVEAAG